MPANFIADSQVLSDLTDILAQGSSANLESKWTGLAAKANLWAAGEIYARLLSRGYTADQVAAWDRAAEFARDLASYRALVMGGALQNVAAELVESLDRRADLREVSVTTGGAFTTPGGTVGVPNTGAFDGTGDMFGTPYDSEDGRLGDTVRF